MSDPPARLPYPSDLSEQQWALIAPMVTMRAQRGRGTRGGRPPR